jgi:hypothetical protein
MPGQNLRLSPLELQKRLLVAESELNRAQMMQDMHDFKGGVLLVGEEIKKLGGIARSFSGIASSAVAVVAGLSAFRRRHNPVVVTKTSWLQLLLRNAGLLTSLWGALRAPKRKQLTQV